MLTIDEVRFWGCSSVIVETTNREKEYGFFAGSEPDPPVVTGKWLFCTNWNKPEYLETKDKALLINIVHKDIKVIRSQDSELFAIKNP